MIEARGCVLKEGCGNAVDDRARIHDKENSSRGRSVGRWLCLFAVRNHGTRSIGCQITDWTLLSRGEEHCALEFSDALEFSKCIDI